jgi:hypothetical protein
MAEVPTALAGHRRRRRGVEPWFNRPIGSEERTGREERETERVMA